MNQYIVCAIGIGGQAEKTEVTNDWANAKRVAEKFCSDLNTTAVIAEVSARFIRRSEYQDISQGHVIRAVTANPQGQPK